jgi:phage repressor protein C with HTH and peptisase S24 domain
MLELKSQASLSLQDQGQLYLVDMPFKDRLRQARKDRTPKTTQADLADLCEVTNQAVSGWERGEAMPETDKLNKIAAFLNVDVGWLLGDDSRAAPPAVIQEVFPGPDIEFDRHGSRDIPVLGTAMGGTENDERPVDFWLTGEIENHVLRPKGLANARNVFVLHVGGDSMEPRFEERDMVYVQKTSPGIGDDVVIELHPLVEGGDHPTFIKRLVRRNGSFITVKQYNPPKELEFTMKEIKNLFRVIPLKELMG